MSLIGESLLGLPRHLFVDESGLLGACQPFRDDLELQKVAQEASKSAQEEPNIAPTHSEDHLRDEHPVFSKIDECLVQNQGV